MSETRLTAAEREALYSPIGNDEAYPELPGVVADLIAARLAPIEALADEHSMCWVTLSDVSCTVLIDGTFPNGAKWEQAMCCLPCRLRAALSQPTAPEASA